MDQKTVQKLSKAIDALVKAEIAWHDCLNDRKGQQDWMRPALERRERARKTVSRILDREFDPVLHEKVVKAGRRAFVDPGISADGFDAVSE